MNEGCTVLLEDFPLKPDSLGGMAEFRQSLVISFFFKFYLTVLAQLPGKTLLPETASAIKPLLRAPTQSSQGFQTVPGTQHRQDSVGRPMMHLSAFKQATGEAR